MSSMIPTSKDVLRLQATGWFDADWYVAKYPDVANVGMDPAFHYLTYGWRLKRDPAANFPVRFFKTVFKIPDTQEPATALNARIAKSGAPKPVAERVLQAANAEGLLGRYDLAEALADTFLPEELKYTANIIRANAAAAEGDEVSWLRHTNQYLGKFGLSPLTISGTGRIFDRLDTRAVSASVDGPLVSILVPAFNAEKTIGMAVRSLLAQTWRNIEVLIVDDCSQDRTWAVMQKLSADDSRIRIFRNEVNAGPYVSKNIAASHARGVWITGHDADDWAHHERIERQVRFCERLQVPASLSGMVRMAANGSFVKLNKIGGFVYDGACRTAFISLMVRNQYYKDILGSWDTVRAGADSEMLHRIEKLQKQPVPSLPEVTMLCYDNPEGLTNHAVFGFKEAGKVPPHRLEYKNNFTAAHIDMTKTNSRLPFPQKSRPFKAPDEMLNEPLAEQKVVRAYESVGVCLTKDIDADFAIIADLSIYGKNATSTKSIIEKLRSTGATINLIHCPADKSLGENISDLFSPWTHLIVNWTEVRKANVKTAICYGFEVLSSSSFGNLTRDFSSEQIFAVRNSPSDHELSPPSADLSQAIDATRKVKTSALRFSATTETLLEELREYRRKSNNRLEITDKPWSLVYLGAYEQQSS